jgi:hypothetical protein
MERVPGASANTGTGSGSSSSSNHFCVRHRVKWHVIFVRGGAGEEETVDAGNGTAQACAAD